MVRRLRAHGTSPWPLTVQKLKLLGTFLHAGRYWSVAGYFCPSNGHMCSKEVEVHQEPKEDTCEATRRPSKRQRTQILRMGLGRSSGAREGDSSGQLHGVWLMQTLCTRTRPLIGPDSQCEPRGRGCRLVWSQPACTPKLVLARGVDGGLCWPGRSWRGSGAPSTHHSTSRAIVVAPRRTPCCLLRYR